MKKVILLRFGELYLKGKNRGFFEKTLISNIIHSLKDIDCKVTKATGRYVVSDYDEIDEISIIDKLTKVFGLVSLSPAIELETNKDEIDKYVSTIKLNVNTFRVSVIRADKTFPVQSNIYERELGAIILKNNANLKVSLKDFDEEVVVDIRESGKTYILSSKIECEGGMPLGTAGKSLLLLSGGIDSPVAGYMIAKRGMKISAIHFHSFPYTSEMAKQKVIKLAKLITPYCGNIKLYMVPFTKIQEEIHKHCAPEFMITIMRRIMMKISAKVAKIANCKAIITGENLGQVASQTVESMTVTNFSQTVYPIFRPLIAFDKKDIIEISRKIGTYETSILPYEDCCTVFLPKNPVIKPKMEKVIYEESKLDIDNLVNEAVKNLEVIDC